MKTRYYLCLLAFAAFVGCDKKDGKDEGQAEVERPAIPIKSVELGKKNFEQRIRVQGNLEVKNYAKVSARLAGTIEELFVDEGDKVEAGKTKLFVIDKANLERSVLTARQSVAAMKQSLKVSEANVEKVGVELKKAKLDKERFERLFKNGNATSNETELYTTKYEQALACMKLAEAERGAVAEQVKSAEVALEIAEKNLSDCIVYSPISGVVSERRKEPGERCGAGDVVVRIDDLTKIEAVAYIPGKYYDAIKIGETKIRLMIDGKDAGEHVVTYKSPVVNPKLRTFEIKSLMVSQGELPPPGVMVDVTLVLVSREGLAVPTHSILTRSRGDMVYVVENGEAIPCGISTGLENEGMTEVFPRPFDDEGRTLKEGDMVISEGHYRISDGDKVR